MEEKKDEEESTLNEGEAEIAIAHAKRLIKSGVRASDIGIITPYSAQVKWSSFFAFLVGSNKESFKFYQFEFCRLYYYECWELRMTS